MKNRNATYYARVYFPKYLVDRGYPRELRFSLKTKQRSTALDRSFAVLHCARTLISHASEKTTCEALIRKIREQVAIVIDNHFTLVVNEQPKQKRVKVASKSISRSSKSNPQKQQDLLAQFIEFKKLEGVKAKNLGLLHSRVKAFVDSCKTQLDCVTSRDANEFLASLYTQKLSIKTVRDYLAAVKQFYNWLVIMQFAVNNPFNLIKVKTDTRLASEQRRKWSNEELWKLFTHDNFTGEIGDNDSKVNYQRKQQDFWLPYILLYTGARVGEICQLKTKDVFQMDGVWCVSINEEDEKSVKTRASVRLVPLHKQLFGLGFLNYVNQRYEAKQEQLFDIKPYGVNQSWSEQFSKRFAKVLKQIDLVGKDRPTLHGLRHTFIDAAQSFGIPENEVADIVGHRKPSLTYGRYAKRVPIIRLQKAVNTIQFKINFR